MANRDNLKTPHSQALSPYEEGVFKFVITLVPITFIAITVLLVFVH
ncbi:MAG: hypothetical protein ABW252_02990 [Polyangiales bacterium]